MARRERRSPVLHLRRARRAGLQRMAAGLRRLGIGPGDVVAIYLPNIPEAAVALLAIPRIGAIVLPLFSGFGADAVVTRLNDAKAKAVITVDGSLRRGRVVAAKQVIDEARTRVPSLQHVIVCHRVDAPMQWTPGVGSPLARCHRRRRRRPLRAVGRGRHALPAGLHLRHHGQAQGRRPHPLRVSGEDGPRSRHLHGLQAVPTASCGCRTWAGSSGRSWSTARR